jgi:hypothetical protein
VIIWETRPSQPTATNVLQVEMCMLIYTLHLEILHVPPKPHPVLGARLVANKVLPCYLLLGSWCATCSRLSLYLAPTGQASDLSYNQAVRFRTNHRALVAPISMQAATTAIQSALEIDAVRRHVVHIQDPWILLRNNLEPGRWYGPPDWYRARHFACITKPSYKKAWSASVCK